MRSRSLWKLLAFNTGFAVLEIILFSPGLFGLFSRSSLLAVTVLAVSVGAFFGINYMLLSQKSEKLADAQDYRDALGKFKNKKNPFNNELDEAVRQLDLFYQKRMALMTLLGEQSDEPGNPFLAVSRDAEECLFANMKKLVNRMTILNPEEPEHFPMHHAFICDVLGQNKELLRQYDNLIIEISQIGDTAQLPDLDSITEALRELRSSSQPSTHAAPLQKGQYDGEI